MFSAPFVAQAPRTRQFVGAYHEVAVQTAVDAASAHQLVTLLFDGFVGALNRARGAMQRADTATKGKAIGHAVRIIDEGLKSALDLRGGGRLAADLSDLYAYICLRLTQANLRNDEHALDECLGLMQPLRDAWTAIGERAGAPARN